MRPLHVLQHTLVGLTDLLLAQQASLDGHSRTAVVIDLILIELRREGRIFQVNMRNELMVLRITQVLTDILLQGVTSGDPMCFLRSIVSQFEYLCLIALL